MIDTIKSFSYNTLLINSQPSAIALPSVATKEKKPNLLEEIQKDLTWSNALEMAIKLAFAYIALYSAPRLQKKIPQNIQVQKTPINPTKTIQETIGIDITGKPFALICGFSLAEIAFGLLRKFSLLPQKPENTPKFDLLEVLIKLGSALACLDLFSKHWNNHLTRFMGLGFGFVLGELLSKTQSWLEKTIQDKLFEALPQLKPADNNQDSFSKILATALSLKFLFWIKGALIGLPMKKVYHFTHMFGEARKLSNDSLIGFMRAFTDPFKIWLGKDFDLPALNHNEMPLKNINIIADWFGSRNKALDKQKISPISKFLLKGLFFSKKLVAKYIIGSPHWLAELENKNHNGFSIGQAITKDYFKAVGAKTLLMVLSFPIFITLIYAGHLFDKIIKVFFPAKDPNTN